MNLSRDEPEPVRRRYRMAARADATAATRARILDAAHHLFRTRPYGTVTLHAVAAQAGVGLQTVIRHGGTKEQLFGVTTARAMARVRESRAQAVEGDVWAVVGALVDHFEEHGDTILHLLAQRDESAAVREATAAGRAEHQEWVARAFAPLLDAVPLADRPRRLAQLQALTDVYTWYDLRREAGLSREETTRALLELLTALGTPPLPRPPGG